MPQNWEFNINFIYLIVGLGVMSGTFVFLANTATARDSTRSVAPGWLLGRTWRA